MRCSRPRGSQIGAVVSHQSSVLAQGRQELEQREKELQQVHSLVPFFVQQQWPLDADDLEAHLRPTWGTGSFLSLLSNNRLLW